MQLGDLVPGLRQPLSLPSTHTQKAHARQGLALAVGVPMAAWALPHGSRDCEAFPVMASALGLALCLSKLGLSKSLPSKEDMGISSDLWGRGNSWSLGVRPIAQPPKFNGFGLD